MQGASPLASPRLNPRGTGEWGRTTRPAGGVSPALPARRALAAPGGGLAFFVARRPCLWFTFLPPIPPAPFPGGEGGDQGFFHARGCAPCIPAPEPARRWEMGANHAPGGGLAFGVASLAQNRQEAVPYEQSRQPRRGGTGGEELRRLRWSSPPGQVEQVPQGTNCSPGTTAAGIASAARVQPPPCGHHSGRDSRYRRGIKYGYPPTYYPYSA